MLFKLSCVTAGAAALALSVVPAQAATIQGIPALAGRDCSVYQAGNGGAARCASGTYRVVVNCYSDWGWNVQYGPFVSDGDVSQAYCDAWSTYRGASAEWYA